MTTAAASMNRASETQRPDAQARRVPGAPVPRDMMAAVYCGKDDVRVKTVPVPAISPGELLVRVNTCGICGTDLKKISTGSHSAPRIFGHEIAGEVAAVGTGVTGFAVGDRVMVFHHIPCGNCYYCRHKVYAQCATYKKVGTTAGFEPSGGGFAEYIRVMENIVAGGVVRIPENVSYEQASFIEPVNTCMKAIQTLAVQPGETVLVIGQGAIGIILGVLAQRAGARVVTSDLYEQRLTISRSLGLGDALNPASQDVVEAVRARTEGRGADAVILAVAVNTMIPVALQAARPGGRVMLFAQTAHSEVTIDPSLICVDEKTLLGSYSASADLQEESARLVCSGEIDFARLITHRFPLAEAVAGFVLAAHPQPDSLKVVIQSEMDAPHAPGS